MRLFLVLLFLAAARLGADVTQGTTEAALLAAKGPPATKVAAGSRVIYGWPDIQVTVVDGVVAKITYKDAATEKAETARRAQLAADAQKGSIQRSGQPADAQRRAREAFERLQSRKRIWAKSFLGQPAPALVVEKWIGDQPAPVGGRFRLIDFWATWCPPCREAVGELNEIRRQFSGRVDVIGVSDESEADVRRMTAPEIQYYVAIDPSARMKKALEVRGIPHVILVDPAGIVRWEGFPLLEGARLTPEVVQTVIDLYEK